MHAAVVTEFGTAPAYREVPVPVPSGPHEALVEVLAAGLHPRVRSQADGSHYTSTGELPLVPGIDGVGRTPDGRLRYFVLPDTAHGSMAERTVVDLRRSVPLPDGIDPVRIAAAMNPAMSAWIALRRRTAIEPGQSVLVLGATGSSGSLAVQIARHLGAGRVVAAGRDPERLAPLADLGADATVRLDEPAAVGAAAGDIDIVLDYLWGAPAVETMTAIVRARTDRGAPLTWIQIGSVAGAEASIPSAALRAARLSVLGSGQGSVPTTDIVAELPSLVDAIAGGAFRIDTRAVPLRDASSAWADTGSGRRIVLVP